MADLRGKESKQKSILITGASSGIGAAMAKLYAAQNHHLFLSDRHAARLKEIERSCQALGQGDIHSNVIDVCDQSEMNGWIDHCDKQHSLDMVVANAGISSGTGGHRNGENPGAVRQVFDINLTGVLNTIDPAVSNMLDRGHGQIAIMSSLAAFSGWPGAPSYSASKAAVRIYGEALRGTLKKNGIKVNVICPGFIKTPMTAVNGYKMPFMISADRAAQIIDRALQKNRGRIAFPWPTYLMAGVIGMLPYGITSRILQNAPEKPDTQSGHTDQDFCKNRLP